MVGWWWNGEMVVEWLDGGGMVGWWWNGEMVVEWLDGGGMVGWWWNGGMVVEWWDGGGMVRTSRSGLCGDMIGTALPALTNTAWESPSHARCKRVGSNNRHTPVHPLMFFWVVGGGERWKSQTVEKK